MANHLQVQRQQLKFPPGFRFHPTDVEIITSYLVPKVLNKSFDPVAVGEVDLNKCEPWELPEKAKMGEKEWYFFSQKDRKYPTGIRTNRATAAGYWKATGKDKEIFHHATTSLIGMKKTLVFYKGRAPRGEKTNWIMHEYRLESGKEGIPGLPTVTTATAINASSKEEYVVCRIFHKSTGLKKVVMSSYAIPMPMSMGAEQQHGFLESDIFPPFMGYGASSSLVPPSSLPAASSYQMHDAGANSSMMGSAVLPMMNDHYFGNHHYQNMATPPRPLMSFYHHDHHHQQQQQQMIQMPMQMQMGADEGLMARVEPGSGPSSIVSQEDTLAGLSSNDIATTADEISSMNMGTDGLWKY